MQQIKIVIVDDMEDIRNYFKMILEHEPNIDVVGMAASRAEAYEVTKNTMPDIVLMDLQMETDHAGIDAIRDIKADFPEIDIIVITMHNIDNAIYEAFGCGATDYILKSDSISQIINTINSIAYNTHSLDAQTTKKLLNKFMELHKQNASMLYTITLASKLTNSELEILKYVRNGMTYNEIASARSVEAGTIRVQINRILKKFNKNSMKKLVGELEHLGFFDIY